MRAVELLKELETYMHFESRGFKTSFGDNLTLVRDDSIKAYVFEKSSRPISIGDLKTIFKSDFFENKEFEKYAVVGKLNDSFSSIKYVYVLNINDAFIQVKTYAEAGEQEPFDLSGDSTGVVDISWYGFWSSEVYRHSFSTACCEDNLGNSIDKEKKFCTCCGRKIDYDNVIKKELHETA